MKPDPSDPPRWVMVLSSPVSGTRPPKRRKNSSKPGGKGDRLTSIDCFVEMLTTAGWSRAARSAKLIGAPARGAARAMARSEEHTSELQSLMRISYAVFCLKKKKQNKDSTMWTTVHEQ